MNEVAKADYIGSIRTLKEVIALPEIFRGLIKARDGHSKVIAQRANER
jgi:hypothetical protein